MGQQRHTAEQIVGKLREAEVLQGKGMPMEEVLRQLGISDATYYKWRKQYGGLRIDQAKRLMISWQREPVTAVRYGC
jgi:putative transposase